MCQGSSGLNRVDSRCKRVADIKEVALHAAVLHDIHMQCGLLSPSVCWAGVEGWSTLYRTDADDHRSERTEQKAACRSVP